MDDHSYTLAGLLADAAALLALMGTIYLWAVIGYALTA